MMDRDLVDKLLAYIETCVVELRTIARLDPLSNDVRERRFDSTNCSHSFARCARTLRRIGGRKRVIWTPRSVDGCGCASF